MADLNRSAGQLVDFGGLAGEAAAVRDLKVTKRNQAFQVLEGNRTMYTCFA